MSTLYFLAIGPQNSQNLCNMQNCNILYYNHIVVFIFNIFFMYYHQTLIPTLALVRVSYAMETTCLVDYKVRALLWSHQTFINMALQTN